MKKLRLIRRSKGISLQSLSKETGVNHSTIWKYESGRTEMQSKLLKKISVFLNVPIEELSKDIQEEAKKCKSKHCLNQRCLLNKECYCQSDQIIAGASCDGQHKTSNPLKAVKINNIERLFIEV